MACEHEDAALIQELIAQGANPDQIPPCGYPAIFQALDIDIDSALQNEYEPDFRITRLLLSLGANPELRDQEGKTIREFAAFYGPPILELFDRLVAPLANKTNQGQQAEDGDASQRPC